MRSKTFVIWASIRWLLLMFVIAPGVEDPAITHTSQPAKPIMVWQCLASWYGSDFEDRLTASGEPFSQDGATAAHRTLPFGTMVRVLNPKTGRSRVVRINDRGPFVEGRGIDVSYRIARELGFQERGVARLQIELLHLPPRR